MPWLNLEAEIGDMFYEHTWRKDAYQDACFNKSKRQAWYMREKRKFWTKLDYAAHATAQRKRYKALSPESRKSSLIRRRTWYKNLSDGTRKKINSKKTEWKKNLPKEKRDEINAQQRAYYKSLPLSVKQARNKLSEQRKIKAAATKAIWYRKKRMVLTN